MGNCAGYCVNDDSDQTRQKVTVEEAYHNPNLARATTLTSTVEDKANEFEIEYGAQQSGQNHQKFPRGATCLAEGNSNGDDSALGPVTLPNGSIYTGQRLNNKKHGRGQ